MFTSACALTLTRQTNATLTTTALGQVSSSHAYNGFAEPTGDTFSAGTTQLYGATYTRDALGRIDTKTETVACLARTYDYGYACTFSGRGSRGWPALGRRRVRRNRGGGVQGQERSAVSHR